MVTSSSNTCDAMLYSGTRDGGLGITRLSGVIPSVQVRRLHRLAQSSDEVIRGVARDEGLEKDFEKLWVAAGGDKGKTPSIWDPKSAMVASEVLGGDKEEVSKWEVPAPGTICPRPCNWRK